ncbi:MAG: serine hydrolase domain-containing protein [Gemmatimonadota bacterium]
MNTFAHRAASLLLIGAFVPLGLRAQSVTARVDSIAQPWSNGRTPGFAVLVWQNGAVVLAKGYGLASVEHRVPITPDTPFLLGSVSKQFTATAIMILADRGKLSYDDRLSKFFPDFPPYADSITVRHLLNHLGGLPEYENLFVAKGLVDKNWPRSITTPPSRFEPTAHDARTLLEKVSALEFAPGSRFRYSNSGYMVLAQIVEKVSGQPFRVFVSENIFAPLGMSHSVLYDETRPVIPGRASSYSGAKGRFNEIDYTPFNSIYGEDNVVTNLTDLAKWIAALDRPQLVRPETQALAFTPGHLNDGSETRYGFGWFTADWGGLRLIQHGGSWVGFRTAIVRFPDSLTVAVLANQAETDAEAIAVAVGAVYLSRPIDRPVARPITAARLGRLAGRYLVAPRTVATITAAGTRATADLPRLGRFALAFDSDSTAFTPANILLRFRFRGGAGGKAERLEIDRMGVTIAAGSRSAK